MKLRLKIDPVTITKSTKPQNTTALFRSFIQFGSTTYVKWGYFDKEVAYGFVYHKINRKVKSKTQITKEWEGKTVKTWKYTYEPAKWVISYYKIPLELLKIMNLRLVQKPRHFELVSK